MKLHRLEITAFGPFAGHEAVEFDQLNEAGVFLLNGETGAGKTSVLDAICFALYASAPTTTANGGRKPGHSDHADPDTAPLVELEFTSGARRWHISRSPAWSKPSKRAASGWSEQHSKVLLREWVDGQWRERSHRPDEVGQTIEHVIGLNREQFTQVMMLPQGRFAEFLRAGSKDREKLLETLFGTDIYPRIQQELKALATSSQAELDALFLEEQRDRQRVSQLDAQFRELLEQLPSGTVARPNARSAHSDDLGGEPGEESAGAVDSRETATQETTSETTPETREPITVAQLCDQLSTATRELRSARDTVSRQQTRAAERARELAQRLENIERHDRLSADLEELHSEQETVTSRETALERHRSAQKMSGFVAAVETATAASNEARVSMAAARDVFSEASPDLERFRGSLGSSATVLDEWLEGNQDLAAVRDTAISARQAAEQAMDVDASVSAVQRDLTEVDQAISQRGSRQRELAQELDGAVEKHAVTERAVMELRDATRDAGMIRDRHDRAQQALKASEEYQELARQRDGDGERYRVAEEKRRAAAQHVEDLETQRFASAAATLASALHRDEPCPVCGSTVHPDPADQEQGQEVTEEMLNSARSMRDSAQSEADRAHARWQAAQHSAAQALGVGALEDITAARETASTSQVAVQELDEHLEQLKTSEQELADLNRKIDDCRETQRQIELQSERDQTRHATLTTQLDQARERLNRELFGFESVRQRIGAAQDLVTAVSAMEVAQRRLDHANQELEYARNTLEAELVDSPFDNSDEVRAARLEQTQAQQIETWLIDYRERLGKVTAELATDVMTATAQLSSTERAGATTESVAEAREVGENLAAQRDRITAASGTLATLERSANDLSRTGGERDESLARAREKSERITGLSAVANGLTADNSLRMTLTSFVLAAKLEHVAAVASEHLQRMSSGRFSLIHTDQARGSGKAGLGLEVDDSWTGNRRGTETLSGGESFFTSLALALALADVVRAAAGGQDMDTLFVDEGFGSLDEDTLEQVLETIDGLRQNGRVIGLVSHVAEMKQRIGTQLVVTKTPKGSHLRVVTGLETNA